jgi:hypothetical protein
MKAYISSQTEKGLIADNPVSVSYTPPAGGNDADKVKALYDAILQAGKFVSLGVGGPYNWPAPSSPSDGIKKITAITLPMPSEYNAPINTSILANAFVGAEALAWVYSFNVTTVGTNAFNGCTKLKEVYLPRTGVSNAVYVGYEAQIYDIANAIGAGAFTGCTALNTAGATIGVGSNLTLESTGLPAGMITAYNTADKSGGYHEPGDVTYSLNDGVWTKRN